MKRYTVSAKTRVLGHEPGTTFEAELSDIQEARLLNSGALRLADDAAPAPPDTTNQLTPEQRTELEALDLEELVELAESLGIEGASDLPNTEAVIDAIAAREGGSTQGDSQHG